MFTKIALVSLLGCAVIGLSTSLAGFHNIFVIVILSVTLTACVELAYRTGRKDGCGDYAHTWSPDGRD